MLTKREKELVKICLDNLAGHFVEDLMEVNTNRVEVNGRVIFIPLDYEIQAVKGKSKKFANKERTKDILILALEMSRLYYETHLLYEVIEEINQLQNKFDEVMDSLPAIKIPTIAWDVYYPDDYCWQDTIFYCGTCDEQYVLRAEEANYPCPIKIVPRILPQRT